MPINQVPQQLATNCNIQQFKDELLQLNKVSSDSILKSNVSHRWS